MSKRNVSYKLFPLSNISAFGAISSAGDSDILAVGSLVAVECLATQLLKSWEKQGRGGRVDRGWVRMAFYV